MDDTNDSKQDDEGFGVYSPKQHIVRVWNVFISLTCLVAVTLCLYEVRYFFPKVPDLFEDYNFSLHTDKKSV